jgi:peptidyl-dipeptidase Dcp
MAPRLTLLLAALFLVSNIAGNATATATETRGAMDSAANPFLEENTLPYGMPPFDRIEPAHFLPAFTEGMARHLAEIERIATSGDAPTFANTIAAMERSGQLLDRVGRVFSNLNGAHTNDELQEIQKTVAPQLAAHSSAIYLNGDLYARMRAIYQQRQDLGLDAESLRVLERYHTDFVRAGANLDEAGKARMREINAELAALRTAFGQNVLAETIASAVVVDSREELAGLSAAQIKSAAEAAAARDLDGKYVLTLQNTTIQPILGSLENRALRERIHRASVSRGARDNDHDNRPIVLRIAALRAERAQLLGYLDPATYVLEDQTAQTPAAVNAMLAQLAPAALANAKREAAEIQELIHADGHDFAVQAWDWAFYAEKVRKQRYALDDAQLKPYFELESVLHNGVFYAAERLFGMTLVERPDLPVYHPDVRVWEVFDKDGSPLGLFFGDFWARESKRGGAWMNQYVLQSGLLGALPVVGNHQNIPKPPAGEPTLMTFREVETMFHEFGHALHGLFSDVRYPRFAGTTVPRDFVEYPSQIYEMWAFWPEVLANYARHHATGEPIPQELLDKVMDAQQFNQGYRTTEYVAASILDQAWHQLPAGVVPDDVAAFEVAVLREAGLDYAPIPPRYLSTYFSHVFSGGYGAAYYAYIWSEVLDADSVEWFKENGGLTRENGERLRRYILSRGGSKDAMELYRQFTGRDPAIEPLLARRGLLDDQL